MFKKCHPLVVFLGGPRHLALNELIKNFTVECIFVPQGGNPRLQDSLKIALDNGIKVVYVTKKNLEEHADLYRDKQCLSLGFPYLFNKIFLNTVKFCLNVHGTLLPKYRGACTLNWVIENGDSESGVTIHLIDEGCDTGPILLQKAFPVSRFDTGRSLYRKTLEFEAAIIIEALNLWDKEKIFPKDQPLIEDIQQFPNRKPHHSELDVNKPFKDLYNKIRAADPDKYPAYFFENGDKIIVKIYRENKKDSEQDLI